MKASDYLAKKGVSANTDKELAELSKKGMARYDSGDVQQKLEILKKKGSFDETKASLNTVLGNTGKTRKPYLFLSVITTGLSKEADELMSLCALRTDGKKSESKVWNYRCSDETVARVENGYAPAKEKYDADYAAWQAEQARGIVSREPRKPFDIFADNGIDRKAYLALPKDNAEMLAGVNEYLAKVSKDAIVIGLNPSSMFDFCRNAGLTMPEAMDILDIVKEHDCDKTNVADTLSKGKGWSFANIVKNNTDTELTNGTNKVIAMAEIVNRVSDFGFTKESLTAKTKKPSVKQDKSLDAFLAALRERDEANTKIITDLITALTTVVQETREITTNLTAQMTAVNENIQKISADMAR